MHKKYIWSIAFFYSASATQIYIENKNTFPVTISRVVIPDSSGPQILNPQLSIQPGQSLPLHTNNGEPILSNFNEITVEFNVDGSNKMETIFFPDEPTQEASLTFTDSGYKRYPFNILKRK